MNNDINKELSIQSDSQNNKIFIKEKRLKMIDEAINFPKPPFIPSDLSEAFNIEGKVSKNTWKNIKHQYRHDVLEWIEIYNIDGYSLGFHKPGKEFFRSSRQNINDMQPYIIKNNEKVEIDESFAQIWKSFSQINKDKELLHIIGCIFYRNAYLMDHREHNGRTRLFLPSESIRFLGDFSLSGIPINIYLHYLDLIATNEDVKYYTKALVSDNKTYKGKTKEQRRTTFSSNGVGRRNTLLTFCNVISVIFGLDNETNHTTHWAKFAAGMGNGVCPIQLKNALEVFPHLKG
jgi:hypothetical protein